MFAFRLFVVLLCCVWLLLLRVFELGFGMIVFVCGLALVGVLLCVFVFPDFDCVLLVVVLWFVFVN